MSGRYLPAAEGGFQPNSKFFGHELLDRMVSWSIVMMEESAVEARLKLFQLTTSHNLASISAQLSLVDCMTMSE